MKRYASLALSLALLASGIALAPPSSAADGPLRQWLKERRLQRQQQGAADAGERITQPGDYRFELEHGGLTRTYRVHVPAKYDPATPAPLLVALHGGGGSMDYQADDARYGLIGKSEREGFVALFPNGFSKLRSGKFATWNAGNCCGGARDENIDDAGFIRQAVDRLTRQMNIDRNRVYATGMSNGGMMAYRLACEMPDVFRAIASVAGTDNTRSCNPKSPVAVLHIHARNDNHVLFAGGAGPGLPDASKVTDFTSVADTVAKWVQLDGCSAKPRRILDKDGAYCELHAPCRGQAEVELCVTESGGHSWPGGQKARGDEPPSQAISANDVMWEFFKRR
ncbi:PHB depolymerase family esterase [Noviherbaspirillum sp. UKPF54]|uniref:extracellular catalytic domain type 1 short-chain-length polyhydroxyalkanoate depolymerase n=1 Tax=Noviherbaspirillum sp. UKPF54 TaxID=2601898 RepID=UPI0011B1AF67|nr:PHB depolymerase family esterase [Noviherbaspirillum sp. UKPF54]QDZ26812.1 poly(3-hydroxybutyrate) depolymerase [Noviherbaspirillum sp. UKPF54]